MQKQLDELLINAINIESQCANIYGESQELRASLEKLIATNDMSHNGTTKFEESKAEAEEERKD